MADLRFDYKNNQKKKTSVFASGLIERDNTATEADILFTLPKEVLITTCHVRVVEYCKGLNLFPKPSHQSIGLEYNCSVIPKRTGYLQGLENHRLLIETKRVL